jgi:hypothetical protein
VTDAVTVWIELTGSPYDGQVMTVQRPPLIADAYDGYQAVTMKLVPTGSVRWVNDQPIEVYVPEAKLGLWRAEHDVDD